MNKFGHFLLIVTLLILSSCGHDDNSLEGKLDNLQRLKKDLTTKYAFLSRELDKYALYGTHNTRTFLGIDWLRKDNTIYFNLANLRIESVWAYNYTINRNEPPDKGFLAEANIKLRIIKYERQEFYRTEKKSNKIDSEVILADKIVLNQLKICTKYKIIENKLFQNLSVLNEAIVEIQSEIEQIEANIKIAQTNKNLNDPEGDKQLISRINLIIEKYQNEDFDIDENAIVPTDDELRDYLHKYLKPY